MDYVEPGRKKHRGLREAPIIGGVQEGNAIGSPARCGAREAAQPTVFFVRLAVGVEF
jgi:hypothetical protein